MRMRLDTSEAKASAGGIVKAMGLVFGDIGTSPIYTLAVIFFLVQPSPENVVGVISLIIWTLIVLVSAEYAWLAMSLSKRGEGGSIVMREILAPMLSSSRKLGFYTILTFIGISLLIGDGVITPAITILSAVEGVTLIPGLEGTGTLSILIIAALIAIGLFAFQKRGSDRVAKSFGPIMLVWFLALAVMGAISIASYPEILKAFNPFYGLEFLFRHGIAGFFILSEVILCATGGEALYADMGHLGRRPIVKAWSFVFIALVLSYLGQGVFAMQNPATKSVFFGMAQQQLGLFYTPMLLLTLMATVIASQAMISGMFSVFYQGITTGLLPRLKVDYTSAKLRSQIYISFVNWMLLLAVLFMIFEFRSSNSLANAYGLAVSGSMAITGIMMTTIFYLRKSYLKAVAGLLVTIVDFIFLASCSMKIPMGGFWSLMIAAIPLTIVLIYYTGHKLLHRSMIPMPLGHFLRKYEEAYKAANRIPGTALYFVKEIGAMPQYVGRVMFDNRIVYEDNIIVSVSQKDEPYGINYGFTAPLASGLRHFAVEFGYMELLKVDSILHTVGIKENAIFYGLEEIQTNNVIWKFFSAMRKLTPTIVQFYRLPMEKLHGVVMRVDLRTR